MPSLIAINSDEFHENLTGIKAISEKDDFYLTTKLTGSKKLNGKILNWFKNFINSIFKAHIAQTTPLKVANVVYLLAEKNQEFLTNHDKEILINIVKRIELKGQKHVKGKERDFGAIIQKIKSLNNLNIPQPVFGNDIPDQASAKDIFNETWGKMPQETFEHILQYLEDDSPNFLKINHQWHRTIINNECSTVKRFVISLIHFLNEQDSKSPLNLFKDSLFSTDLDQVSLQNIFDKKIELAELIKTIPFDCLNELDSCFGGILKKTLVFNDFFIIALLMNKLYESDLKENEDLFKESLEKISLCFRVGKISKKGSLQIIKKLTNSNYHTNSSVEGNHSLKAITILLAQKGLIKEAIEVGNMVSDEAIALSMFKDVFHVLDEQNQLDHALDFIKESTSNLYVNYETSFDGFSSEKVAHSVEENKKFFSSIPEQWPDNYELDDAVNTLFTRFDLYSLFEIYAEKKDWGKAREHIEKIEEGFFKDAARIAFTKVCLDFSQTDLALIIALDISELSTKRDASLETIAFSFVAENEMGKARKMIDLVKDIKIQISIINEINSFLFRKGKFEEAYKYIKTISSPEVYEKMLAYIIEKFPEEYGRIVQAELNTTEEV